MAFVARLMFVFFLMLNADAGPAPGEQQSAEPGAKQRDSGLPVIRDTVDLVSVTFSVRDHKRRFVAGLKKDDFEVFEDAQKQDIAFFSTESDLPLTVGLLVDCSGSQATVLLDERDATAQFLDAVLRDQDRAFIMTFGSELRLVQDFTDDRNLLRRSLEQLRPCGGTRFFDAIFSASRNKLFGREGRKALIALTDGVDTGSQLSPEQAMASLFRVDAPLYVVFEPAGAGFQTRFWWERVGREFTMLNQWTEATGGRALFRAGLRKSFTEIAEELRNQYTIAYRPRNTNPAERYRTLSIKSVRKGLRVQARKGYFAPAP